MGGLVYLKIMCTEKRRKGMEMGLPSAPICVHLIMRQKSLEDKQSNQSGGK